MRVPGESSNVISYSPECESMSHTQGHAFLHEQQLNLDYKLHSGRKGVGNGQGRAVKPDTIWGPDFIFYSEETLPLPDQQKVRVLAVVQSV